MIDTSDIYLVSFQSYQRQKADGFKPRKDSTPWPLTLPLNWSADPFKDANWRAQLMHWRMTDPILAEYSARPDQALLREALSYVLDWHRFHFVEGRLTPISWMDSSTGIRSLRLAFILDAIKRSELVVSEVELSAVHDLVDEHARRLTDESLIAKSNHAIFQVLGLKLLSQTASDRDSCRAGEEYADRKFKEVLHNQFDERGVHREHSPAYHFWACALLSKLGRHFDSPEIASLLDLARSRAKWLVLPDGTEPRVGDSAGSPRKTISKPSAPVAHTTIGPVLVGDLNQSGYAIIRSVDDRSMLFVTGVANSSVHKHADDLSFELFEHGRRIFVDSGKYGYFRRDPFRRYMRSAAAHNTISIKDRTIRPSDIVASGSALRPTLIDGDQFVIEGAIERPGLFTQKRTFFYSPSRYIVVRDILSAAVEQNFVSSLHIAPDLTPDVNSDGFSISIDGRRIGGLTTTSATIDSARGQTSPLLGWCSPSYGAKEPLTVIRAHVSARRAEITWVIWLDDRWKANAIHCSEQVGGMGRL